MTPTQFVVVSIVAWVAASVPVAVGIGRWMRGRS